MTRLLKAARAVAVVLSLGIAACAQPARDATRAVRADTLFYISARSRDPQQRRPQLAESLEYGLVITERPSLRDATTDGARIRILDSVLVTRSEWIARLRARMAPSAANAEFALLYTHGYGTSLHDLWEHSALSRLRSQGEQPWVAFSWPSIGSGVAWPRDGDVLTTAYRADSAQAAASHAAFAEALAATIDAVDAHRLVVVAHSLGGQLVGESLREDSLLRARLVTQPLRALAFVSPDVEVTHFGSVIVPALQGLANRVLLYASADDRVLLMSRGVNHSVRAGRIERERDGAPAIVGLESVDMTEGRHANSWVVNAFGTRHAIRRKSAALFDLVFIVGAQRAANCRLVLGTGRALANGTWALTDVMIPAPAAAAECPPYQLSELLGERGRR